MNVKKKFLIVFLLVNLLIIGVSLNCFEVRASSLNEMEDSASSFLNKGKTGTDTLNFDIGSITAEFMGLGQILTTIGAGVMVAAVSFMGIKYIISPPDKQAALKQQLIGLVVAGVVIFGAYGIWSAVINIAKNF